MQFGNFTFESTPIEGLRIIRSRGFEDSRGVFYETYNGQSFHAAGLTDSFKQDNQSWSKKGVLRGLHYQYPHWQSKLVRVVSGHVFDVAVDLRQESPTFGHAFGIELKPDGTMFYIPEGFAHGFLTLEASVFSYKCGDLYDPQGDRTLRYDEVSIPWDQFEIGDLVISDKDLKGLTLEQVIQELDQNPIT